ncbi:MAG: hypothetical protein Q9197_003803 [Variospora fuerteventurae]
MGGGVEAAVETDVLDELREHAFDAFRATSVARSGLLPVPITVVLPNTSKLCVTLDIAFVL